MFTGKLGTSESRLGNFKLAAIGGGGGTGTTYDNSITISGTSTLSATAGVIFYNNLELISQGQILVTPGFRYSDSVSIDAEASFDSDFTYFKNETITIAGESSLDVDFQHLMLNTLTISSTGSLTVASIASYGLTLNIDGRSYIDVETFYNILLDTNAVSSITISSQLTAANNQNPVAVSGFGVESQAVYNRTITQTLALNQSAHLVGSIKNTTQNLNLTQNIIVHTIHNKSVNQTLIFNQQALRLFPTSNTITFVQQVAYTKVYIRSITQTLNLIQSGSRTSVLSREIIQTYRPFQGGISRVPIHGPSGIEEYVQLPVYVFKKSKNEKCYIILRNDFATLLLPCPQLGDTENYLGTLNLKRTMTGETITYIKKSRLHSLNYTFWLGRLKTIEAEDFVFNYAHLPHRLHNWKGEEWLVHLTNTPFQFTGKERYQPQGERYDITFEFTGTKIGG